LTKYFERDRERKRRRIEKRVREKISLKENKRLEVRGAKLKS